MSAQNIVFMVGYVTVTNISLLIHNFWTHWILMSTHFHIFSSVAWLWRFPLLLAAAKRKRELYPIHSVGHFMVLVIFIRSCSQENK